MVRVADVLNWIETIAPVYMKEEWDHVGLNCGRLAAPVTKVLVALDPFDEAIAEAKEMGAELLVTHHALIWSPDFVTDADPQGRRTLELIESGIAHINAHTNLDLAPGGVNDVLAGALGLKDVQVMDPVGADKEGKPYGLLRRGSVTEQPLEQFLVTVKEALGCEGLRYVNCGKPVRQVAVGGGACGGGLMDAVRAGCDTFVTADVKYNQFRDAYDAGLNLIDAGHFHTEKPVCARLAASIAAQFPELTVKVSQNHTDHMKFF